MVGISIPRAHQEGIPLGGRPAQTVWMNSSLVLIGPSGLSDRMRWGAMVVPLTSSPWHRAQFRLNCFHPLYTACDTVSRGAWWYASRSEVPAFSAVAWLSCALDAADAAAAGFGCW